MLLKEFFEKVHGYDFQRFSKRYKDIIERAMRETVRAS